MSTDLLRIAPDRGPIPTAAQHNGLLDLFRREALLGAVFTAGDAKAFPHPWQVRGTRFVERPAATLDPAGTWALTVAAATINDLAPTMLYRRTGDPRGWVPPEGYVEPFPDLASPWLEREADDDPDDPPHLYLLDPPASPDPIAIPDTLSFTRIADDRRPALEAGAFCGAGDWELELWRAHIILTATPLRAGRFAAELPAPRLKRYRLQAVRARPAARWQGHAGGWLEIATIYLLRPPGDPAGGELHIRQRVWWDLRAVIVQPGAELIGILDSVGTFDPTAGLLLDLYRAETENQLSEVAFTEFWTV